MAHRPWHDRMGWMGETMVLWSSENDVSRERCRAVDASALKASLTVGLYVRFTVLTGHVLDFSRVA